MNTIPCIAWAALIPLVPGIAYWYNEFRLRKLAEARLGLVQAATRINELMLAGEVTVGQVCHDDFCRFIIDAQHRQDFRISWNFIRLASPEAAAIRKKLDEELRSKNHVREVMQTFVMKYVNAFRYSRPFSFACFATWAFACRGGLRMILVALKLALTGAKSLLVVETAFQKFKREIGALFLSMEIATQEKEQAHMPSGDNMTLVL